MLATILLLHVALALLSFMPAPHTGGDNAGYLALARSLLEHHQYREIYDPVAPPHTQYPPGFPLMLALGALVGIKSWVKIKLLIIAFSAIAVAFSYLWIRRHGRPELATAVALMLALAPGVLEQSHWELSDVPFWAITMIAIWGWQRLPDSFRGHFIAAVLATTLAYFTRSAGLPLLVAAAAWLAVHRRWRQLAVFAAVIGPLALWWYLRARHQGGVDYVGQFWWVDPYQPALGKIGVADLLARMKDNSVNYVTRHLPILLFGVQGLTGLSLLIIAFALYGWGARFRHFARASVAELFLPLYIGLLLIWPAVWSGERFLLPALPFILFYAGDALVRITRLLSRSAARLLPAAAAALLVLIGIPATAEQVRIGSACTALYRAGDEYACLPDQYREFYRVAEVMPRLLPDNARVIARKPRSFYIMGGVPARQFPLSDDPARFFREVEATGARYVVLDRLDRLAQEYVVPVLVKQSNAFCILFSLGPDRTMIFGIDPLAARQPPARFEGGFPECGAQYWRSAAVKDSVMRGLIRFD